MIKYSLVTFVFCVALTSLRAADLPEGYDAESVEKMEKGEILQTTLVDEPRELKTIARAYFKGVSSEAYFKLLTSYARYPGMVPLVATCAPLPSSEKNIYKYDIYLRFTEGFVTVPIRAHGYHKITPITAENPVGKAFNKLTYVKGHTEKIDFIEQTTALYPYKDGLLVEDVVHLKLKDSFKQATAEKLKQHLTRFFSEYVGGLRKNLQ